MRESLTPVSFSNVVSPLVACLLPSFCAAIFAVTLVHVLFLSGGAGGLLRDSDTGWHIRSGEQILSAGSVPYVDAFSYTRAGRPWFAWEWLSDVLIGAVHRLGGLPAVALLVAFTIAVTIWLAARLSLFLGANVFFTVASTLLMIAATSLHWLARPHVFSWGIALVFLAIAERERHHPGSTIYVLPFVACIWANLHGSFFLGPAILYIYAIGEWLSGPVRHDVRNRFALAGLASFAATFANPYGWNLHQHVLTYVTSDYLMDRINEFQSFNFHADGAVYVELFLLIAILGALAMVRQRAFGPALLVMAMLHLSLYSARHIATSAVLLLPLSVAALSREAELWPRLRAMAEYARRIRVIDRQIWGIVPVVLTLAIGVAGVSAGVTFDPSRFPVQAADFLERQNPSDRVFASDQWGGYLIYRFAGERKVFIDGRSDFYGQGFLETYATVLNVKPGWQRVLEQYDVRFVLVPPDAALASALELSAGWKRVHADKVAAVFENQTAATVL
ncbi:MAG: hypothetical protein HY646_02650 [Acidobacteria bacterium]|nr:hypothetical protein [Acidobacteriota bacterium]